MSGEDTDDPAWRRIKAQTRPLIRKQAQSVQTHVPPPKPNVKPKPSPRVEWSKPTSTKRTEPAQAESMSGHKRVRRGRVDIGWKTDLHGLNHDGARNRLLDDLLHARTLGVKAVLVITGKGRGILREALPRWLNEIEFRELVSGHAPAHARHGGGGACYVFLRNPHRQ